MRTTTFACLVVLTTGFAGIAHANGADPSRCTVQGRFIDVEGATNGTPDACSDARCGDFTVIVRDFANNVVAGATVTVDFTSCPDITIACDQLDAATGQHAVGAGQVAATADQSGRATFRIQGAATAIVAGASGTAVNIPCARVYAGGVLLSPALVVAAYDVNGIGSPGGAVNGADVALVAAEAARAMLGFPAHARVDYNHSGTVNGADIARSAAMAADAASGTGSQAIGPACP